MNAGKYILIGFIAMIGFGIYNNFVKSTPDQTRESATSRYFSAYDGSNPELVQFVKKNMKDADSFNHVSTSYSDNGNGTLKITMVYTGANSAGIKFKNNVNADFNMGTHSLSNISTLNL